MRSCFWLPVATLLLVGFCVLTHARYCEGPLGSPFNFNGSVRMSFVNATATTIEQTWWDARYQYPNNSGLDPRYCDSFFPNTYALSPYVCPSDRWLVTSVESCPAGCTSYNGTCKGGCGDSDRGNCSGPFFDCDFHSQLRWGTPGFTLNPALWDPNQKSGFAWRGNQTDELPCSVSNYFGDLVHLNWIILEDPGADAFLSFQLDIESMQTRPLQWIWHIVHHETNNYACAETWPALFPCCNASLDFCPYGGDPCDEGCADVVGFYTIPYNIFTNLKTVDFGKTDFCTYTVEVWMNTTYWPPMGPLVLNSTTKTGVRPTVVAWEVTAEQERVKIPFMVKITGKCPCDNVACDKCSECDKATGKCSPYVACTACKHCDPESGICIPAAGQNCSTGSYDCVQGICDAQAQCVPTAVIAVNKTCGVPQLCAQSLCDASGNCVKTMQPDYTICVPPDASECVGGVCLGGICSPHSLDRLPCNSTQLPPPSDPNAMCQRAVCKNKLCVLTPNVGANCTAANVTCEYWSCNASGVCVRNKTGLCLPPIHRGKTWIIVAAVVGAAFALIAIAAIIFFLTGSSTAPVAGGIAADMAVGATQTSPLYVSMGVEGTNPLYAATP